LDGDGGREVVIGSFDFKVYAWHHDGTAVTGWPQATESNVHASPALGDLDGDGDLEVVVGSFDGKVYAWHHDGVPVSGWPQVTGGKVHDAAALADLDGDGDLEVVVGSFDGKVYAWHHDGVPVSGWPQATEGEVRSSPGLGDLDGDGDLEVVVSGWDGCVYAWHGDGTAVTGWPQAPGGHLRSSPVLGDLDGDGYLEVVVGSDDHCVYAWHQDGGPVLGWPQSTGGAVDSSPALGDLDGDGDLEVVVGSYDGKVYAWHHGGVPVSGWPQSTGDVVESSSPALGDLDGDGDLEVVVGSFDNKVHAWSCDIPTEGQLVWPMFRHDRYRTGRYGVVADFSALPRVGTAPLAVRFTDLSIGGPTSWLWRFGDGATSTEQNPSHEYSTPGYYTVTLAATEPLSSGEETRRHAIWVSFPDAPLIPPPAFWAAYEIIACATDNIVQGFPDGTYGPDVPVARDQMAVYIARALARGDASVPSGPEMPTFPDVLPDHWAYKYIEYAAQNNIVVGYWNGYRPAERVDRAQMAVYIARSIVEPTGEAGLVSYVPPTTPTFADVDTGFWAYKHIEYCYEQGVVQGYWDGYHPNETVNRAQMAVYVQRAFSLWIPG
jgi:hypothetical protein